MASPSLSTIPAPWQAAIQQNLQGGTLVQNADGTITVSGGPFNGSTVDFSGGAGIMPAIVPPNGQSGTATNLVTGETYEVGDTLEQIASAAASTFLPVGLAALAGGGGSGSSGGGSGSADANGNVTLPGGPSTAPTIDGATVGGAGPTVAVPGSPSSSTPSWLTYLVPALGGIAGAAINTIGTTTAANDQAATAAAALAFEEQQLAKKQAALTPYETLGLEGGNQLAGLLGVAPTNETSAFTPQPGTPGLPAGSGPTSGGNALVGSGTAPDNPAPSGSPNLPSSGTVQMIAPDGTTSAVPASLVSYYQSLGAQVVP